MPLRIELVLEATDEEHDQLLDLIERVLGHREEMLVVRIEQQNDIWTLMVSTGDLRREVPLFPQEHKPELLQLVLEDLVQNLGEARAGRS